MYLDTELTAVGWTQPVWFNITSIGSVLSCYHSHSSYDFKHMEHSIHDFIPHYNFTQDVYTWDILIIHRKRHAWFHNGSIGHAWFHIACGMPLVECVGRLVNPPPPLEWAIEPMSCPTWSSAKCLCHSYELHIAPCDACEDIMEGRGMVYSCLL